jgi:hypothetical protein
MTSEEINMAAAREAHPLKSIGCFIKTAREVHPLKNIGCFIKKPITAEELLRRIRAELE